MALINLLKCYDVAAVVETLKLGDRWIMPSPRLPNEYDVCDLFTRCSCCSIFKWPVLLQDLGEDPEEIPGHGLYSFILYSGHL